MSILHFQWNCQDAPLNVLNKFLVLSGFVVSNSCEFNTSLLCARVTWVVRKFSSKLSPAISSLIDLVWCGGLKLNVCKQV